MFLAMLGLLVCCAASAETPTPPQQASTIYRSGERTTEIKAAPPDRYDVYDTPLAQGLPALLDSRAMLSVRRCGPTISALP
jgi:hypothetical protein